MINAIKTNPREKGFTLIELVVVMAIIAILMVVLIGAILAARNASSTSTNRANANSLRVGFEAHFAKYGSYCGTAAPQVVCTTLSPSTFTAAANALNTVLGANSVKLGNSTAGTGNAGGGRITNITPSSVLIQPVDNDNANLSLITLP